jgi:hypothetical protein
VSVKPGESQIAYLLDKQLIVKNTALGFSEAVTFDISKWEYLRPNHPPVAYKMAWRPASEQILLFSNGDAGGYTFLLDASSGEICEVDLGGWAVMARWSPDGRYLAVIRTRGTLPVDFSDLAVLDMFSGKLHAMSITPAEIVGRHFVNDVAWEADSVNLLAIGQVLENPGIPTSDDYILNSGLYVVDFLSGQSLQVLQKHKLGSGLGAPNLVLSPDGAQLIVQCPTLQEGRLCSIFVEEE